MILLRQYIGTKNHNWTKETVAGDILRSNMFGSTEPEPTTIFPKICIGEVWKNVTEVFTVLSGAWKQVTEVNIVQTETWKGVVE